MYNSSLETEVNRKFSSQSPVIVRFLLIFKGIQDCYEELWTWYNRMEC